MITQLPLGATGGGSGSVYPPVTQIDSSPVEGASMSITATVNDVTVRMTPAAQLTSVTVKLPNPAEPRIRQIVFIHTTVGISELMVTADPGIQVDSFIADMQPGDCIAYFRISATIWARIRG